VLKNKNNLLIYNNIFVVQGTINYLYKK